MLTDFCRVTSKVITNSVRLAFLANCEKKGYNIVVLRNSIMLKNLGLVAGRFRL